MALILNGCVLLLKEHHLLKKADIVFDNEITAVTYDSRRAQKDRSEERRVGKKRRHQNTQ